MLQQIVDCDLMRAKIMHLINQSDYLSAESLFHECFPASSPDYETNRSQFTDLFYRADLIRDTIQTVENITNSGASEDWTLGLTYFGITTHYKVNNDNLLFVRIEGDLENTPFFEQAAVIYEVDLFKSWVPFCFDSIKIEDISMAEVLTYMSVLVPPFGRDALVHVFAADCLKSHNKIVLIGKSANDVQSTPPPDDTAKELKSGYEIKGDSTYSPSLSSVEKSSTSTDASLLLERNGHETNSSTNPSIKFVSSSFPSSSLSGHRSETSISNNSRVRHVAEVPWNKGWFWDRMVIHSFNAVFTIIEPKKVKTSFIFAVEPRTRMPKSLINFVVRNMAGMFLYFFQRQVLKVGTVEDCVYRKRMRENPAFYRDWLLPKFIEYYNSRGWTLDDFLARFQAEALTATSTATAATGTTSITTDT